MSLAPDERYERLGELGAGAMGVVYEVYDRKAAQRVALKTLTEPAVYEALYLRREFRALQDIRSPYLVRLFDLWAGEDECFFTMELIRGVDVYTAARAGRPHRTLPADLGRVAQVFLQVAHGLAEVHAAGRLHRDVKPSNVMVTAEGRAVVLDFGLAFVFTRRSGNAGDGMTGTVEYTSPEQGWFEALGPPTDWWSFGTMLFEALCGLRPYADVPAARLMLRIRDRDAPPLSNLVDAPADLVELCARLLSRAPETRAGYPEVVEVLGRYASGGPVETSATLRVPFVGREQELDRLRAGHAAVSSSRQPSLLFVHGLSGMGKSALVNTFLEDVTGGLVLQGRCQPQESVPFKAFDALVDELALHLTRMTPDEVRPLLPDSPGALVRLFPVLRAVPQFDERATDPLPPEPQEARRWGYAAFRSLLARLASTVSLVLHIDDFQWGDADSVALLAELLRNPGAPAVTVVVSHRSEDLETSRPLRALRDVAPTLGANLDDIAIGPLSPDLVATLATSLVDPGPAGSDVLPLLSQAGGSPFFLGELLRWQRESGGELPPGVGVADLVRHRVSRLSDEERASLEVISIAGHPLDAYVALRAAGVTERCFDTLDALFARFVRRVGTDAADDLVEPLHDRIREVVSAEVDAARAVSLHAALARVLRAEADADPIQLLDHYRKAGQTAEAAYFGEIAARRAEDGLAFGLAAELYRTVLSLGGEERADLWERLADARKNAGHGVDAAQAYEAAAARVAHESAWRLRQRAAEQYLHNGVLDKGMALLRENLAHHGVNVASGPTLGLATSATLRARLLWRGLRYEERPTGAEAPATTERLDALLGATASLSMFAHARADAIGVRYLLEALDKGDARRVRRALRYEAGFSAGLEGSRAGWLVRRLGVLDAVARLPREEDEPYDRGWMHLCDTVIHWFRADWKACAAAGRAGEAIFRTECRGAHWEIGVIHLFLLAALVFAGEVEEVTRRTQEALVDAQRRSDLFAATICRLGEPLTAWLYLDEPDEAERLARAAMAEWPSLDFDTQDYHALLALTQLALYRGEGDAAWEAVTARWSALEASLLLEYQAVKCELVHLRGRAALAAGRVADARAAATTLARMGREGWSVAMAAHLQAALAAPAAAAPLYEAAREGFVRAGMPLHAAAMAWRAGAPLPDLPGVRAPARLLGMLAPALRPTPTS